MHAHRPQNLNVWVKYYVGSEFEVEHIQFLRLDLKIDKQTQTMKTKNNCLVISFQGAGVTTCRFDRTIPLFLLVPGPVMKTLDPACLAPKCSRTIAYRVLFSLRMFAKTNLLPNTFYLGQ